MGRVFILDPGFGSSLGHHFVANSVLASSLGRPLSILAATKLPVDVEVDNATIERFFRVPLGAAAAQRRAAKGRSRAGFWRGLRDVARYWGSGSWGGNIYEAELARFFASREVDRSDHIIVHSANELFLGPLTRLASALTPEAMPTLHIRLLGARREWQQATPDLGPLKQLIATRHAFLYAEMEVVASAVREGLGVNEVDLLRLALPVTGDVPDRVGRIREGRKFEVLYFGSLRDEKGWRRIPRIGKLLSQADPDGFRVVMHVGNPWTLARLRNREVRRAIKAADVVLLEGHLTNHELGGLLSEADLVIMPYLAESYRLRGSGVGLDSVAHGVPLVVTAGCCLGEFVGEGNGLEADSDEEFAAAIVRIRKDYASFARKAAQAQLKSLAWVREGPLARRIAGEPG